MVVSAKKLVFFQYQYKNACASVACLMSSKSEAAMFRICGNCGYANRRLESREIRLLRRKIPFKQQYSTYLRNPLRDEKVLCRKENINVNLLEEACAFWRPH